jgi:hypothetical protein
MSSTCLPLVFYIGDPDMIISCLTRSTLSIWQRLNNARSLSRHWQIHLPGRLTCPSAMADDTSLYPNVVSKTNLRELYEEKPAETQTCIWLASYLVRVPNSYSGGSKCESPVLT